MTCMVGSRKFWLRTQSYERPGVTHVGKGNEGSCLRLLLLHELFVSCPDLVRIAMF